MGVVAAILGLMVAFFVVGAVIQGGWEFIAHVVAPTVSGRHSGVMVLSWIVSFVAAYALLSIKNGGGIGLAILSAILSFFPALVITHWILKTNGHDE